MSTPSPVLLADSPKIPDAQAIETMLAALYDMREDLDATVELAKTLRFPEFTRETEYVALVSDSENVSFA